MNPKELMNPTDPQRNIFSQGTLAQQQGNTLAQQQGNTLVQQQGNTLAQQQCNTLAQQQCNTLAQQQLQHFKHICPAVFNKPVCDKFTYVGDREKFFRQCIKKACNVTETCPETPP